MINTRLPEMAHALAEGFSFQILKAAHPATQAPTSKSDAAAKKSARKGDPAWRNGY